MQKEFRRVTASSLLILGVAGPVWGQLSNTAAPVALGHYNLNVTSIDEHLRFWVEGLGGQPVAIGGGAVNAVRFPDVFLFLVESPPTGPTYGTTFDHIGFAVPDVPAMAAHLVAMGYTRTVGREPGPDQPESPPTAGNYGRFEYLIGPDGVKIELVTNQNDDPPPIAHHHVHFVNREFVEMQQWYMHALNATLRPGQTDFFIGADLPEIGYMLNFFSWLPDVELVGTSGRAVEHVGFEVRNLQAFCDELVAKGIELTRPYYVEDGIGFAVITDPWGTVIELTEGIRALY